MRFAEKETIGFSPAGLQTVHFTNQDSLWVTRIGVNYRFGGAPLLANY